MSSINRFFQKNFITSIGTLLLFVSINLIIILGISLYVFLASSSSISVSEFSEHISVIDQEIVISDEALNKLKVQNNWAMILDDFGVVIWSENFPDELQTSYTSTEIAKFSRWYLDEYPISVWEHSEGLLVVGFPTDSIFKYNLSIKKDEMFALFFGTFFLILSNLVLLIYLLFRNFVRVEKAIKPIIIGIDKMSKGKVLCLASNSELPKISEELNLASERLSKKESAQADWIAAISHDIRTPLTMILGYSNEISEDKMLPQNTRIQADIIIKQSEKIKELVTNLNVISRLEYSMQPLTIQNIDMIELLRKIVSEFVNNEKYDSFIFSLENSENGASLIGDYSLLYRMFENILYNSVKHNLDGCEISIKVDMNDDACLFTISDNGKGISDEKLEELNKAEHKPIYTSRNSNNHGLGLKIVNQIVYNHNGTIRFKSNNCKGLCISIKIPKKSNYGV